MAQEGMDWENRKSSGWLHDELSTAACSMPTCCSLLSVLSHTKLNLDHISHCQASSPMQPRPDRRGRSWRSCYSVSSPAIGGVWLCCPPAARMVQGDSVRAAFAPPLAHKPGVLGSIERFLQRSYAPDYLGFCLLFVAWLLVL